MCAQHQNMKKKPQPIKNFHYFKIYFQHSFYNTLLKHYPMLMRIHYKKIILASTKNGQKLKKANVIN